MQKACSFYKFSIKIKTLFNKTQANSLRHIRYCLAVTDDMGRSSVFLQHIVSHLFSYSLHHIPIIYQSLEFINIFELKIFYADGVTFLQTKFQQLVYRTALFNVFVQVSE